MIKCDDKLGVCTPANIENEDKKELKLNSATLFYIGDPMCSWCYAMSDILKEVEEYCTFLNINFKIIVAGLRGSKSEEWNSSFKSFLKNEWINISKVASKEFSFELFNLDYFDYDTTNACKAILIVKKLLKDREDNNKTTLEFFSKIQKKFYAQSLDTKELDFYKDICEDLNISFDEFSKLFLDNKIEQELKDEFRFSRTFSSSMPSLILVKDGKKIDISIGYSSFSKVASRIDFAIKG